MYTYICIYVSLFTHIDIYTNVYVHIYVHTHTLNIHLHRCEWVCKKIWNLSPLTTEGSGLVTGNAKMLPLNFPPGMHFCFVEGHGNQATVLTVP